MDQLLAVIQRRRPFRTQYRRLKRQRDWLVELDQRLDPPEQDGQPRPTRRDIKRQVKEFLAELERHAQTCPEDGAAVEHICATFQQRWPRLFACYAWPERWRTNNDLESFFGRWRTRQRQIHGRKSVHEFIIRYGEWAVYIDPTESFAQVLLRFQQFDQAKLDEEYARFLKARLKLRVQYRFRHNPRRCLKELEQQWDAAVHYKSHKSAL